MTTVHPLTRAYRPVVGTETWRTMGKVFLDVPLSLTLGLVVLVPAVVALPLVMVLPAAVLIASLALVANRAAAAVDRAVAAELLDLDLAPGFGPRPVWRWWSPLSHWRCFVAELADGATWRAVAWRALNLVHAPVAAGAVLIAWCVPIVAATSAVWIWSLPGQRIDLGPIHATGWTGVVPATVAGLALLPAGPLVVRAVGHGERRLLTAFLGPRRDAELTERISEVESSRARVVDAAEAERRRIERDLHDGAQQRLVALAMNLGMAKEKLASDPAAAADLVDEAHAEAKRALVELRDLARGLHPAVLTDRGLGPALSAVAARSPVPVAVSVDLHDRLDEATEGIAYFVVCEALTNVAKHSDARSARVTVARRGDRLIVEVGDDGVGGAVDTGTGLQGLRDRVEGVDGWFHVASPPGGPTTLTAELPCAS